MKICFKLVFSLLLCLCITTLFIQAEESAPPTVTFDCVISSDSATLEVTVTLSNCPKVKAIGLKPSYDSESLEYVSGEWLIGNALLSDWGMDSSVLAYSSEKDINTDVAKYLFKIKDYTTTNNADSFSIKVSLKNNSGDITIETTQNCTHLWGTERLTKSPSCFENGYDYFRCIICAGHNKIADTETDKLEHTPSDWIIDKEATQQEEGQKHTECSVCHTILKTETIPLLSPPQSTDPDTPQTDPESTPDGSEDVSDKPEERKMAVIWIVLIIIGSTVAAFVLIILIIKLIKKRKRKKSSS